MESRSIDLSKRELAILELLRTHKKGISTFELMEKALSTRPSNEIVTLRKKGFIIKTIYLKNQESKKIFGIYVLVSEPGEQE